MKILSRRNVICAGFSLIELLVVLGIIGVLLALILPGISYVRQRARATDCANRLHQIGVALQTHQSLHGSLPADGENGYGYGVYLLPNLEQTLPVNNSLCNNTRRLPHLLNDATY